MSQRLTSRNQFRLRGQCGEINQCERKKRPRFYDDGTVCGKPGTPGSPGPVSCDSPQERGGCGGSGCRRPRAGAARAPRRPSPTAPGPPRSRPESTSRTVHSARGSFCRPTFRDRKPSTGPRATKEDARGRAGLRAQAELTDPACEDPEAGKEAQGVEGRAREGPPTTASRPALRARR